MLVDMARSFVERELYPHEEEIERTGELRPELVAEIKKKAIDAGLYAANMPAELGGGGLDTVSWVLLEKELGRANYALHWTCVARPSNILQACTPEQADRYLHPVVTGEKIDCLAMTEPGAGSDVRSMKTNAVRDGDDWVINGTKHFISHADVADFVILFAATGEEETPRGPKKKITSFLVDMGTPGFTVRAATTTSPTGATSTASWSSTTAGCRPPRSWARSTRASTSPTNGLRRHGFRSPPPASAARERAWSWPGVVGQPHPVRPADLQVPGRVVQARRHGDAAQGRRLLTLHAAWKNDQGTMEDMDAAMAKLHATEMLAMVADEAIQIYGGMGLMDELPLERIWRDHRVERIWEGTSEIQRHIISRSLLRPLGG